MRIIDLQDQFLSVLVLSIVNDPLRLVQISHDLHLMLEHPQYASHELVLLYEDDLLTTKYN